MKKLGILIHQILDSQHYVTIARSLNNISVKNPEIDIILFHTDLGNSKQLNNFPMMSTIEALDYDGILIATDIISSCVLEKCMCAKKKYFYVSNIDWNMHHQKDINFTKKIYLDPNVKLIARSEDHAKLINRVFRPVENIIEDFDYEQLVNQIVYA